MNKTKTSKIKVLFTKKYFFINLSQMLLLLAIIISLMISFIPLKLTMDTQKENYDLMFDLVKTGQNSENPQEAIYNKVTSENINYNSLYSLYFIYFIVLLLFIFSFVFFNTMIELLINNGLHKLKKNSKKNKLNNNYNFFRVYLKNLILFVVTAVLMILSMFFIVYIMTNINETFMILISALILVISLIFMGFLGFNILQTVLLIKKDYFINIKQKIYYLCKLSLIQSFILIILTNLCSLIEYFIPFFGIIIFFIIFSIMLNYSRIYLRELL